MLKIVARTVLLSLVATAPAALADELGDAAQALCEKVKSCAIEQMEGQEITPEMRQMMQPMLDGMCAQVRGRVGEVPTGHPMYKPAVACMQSMQSLSCDSMQDAGQVITPECEEYEKLARESDAKQ